MGTTLAVISAENNTPTNFTNRCFWSLSSWLLPLPTPRNSPSSTKSPSPSSDLLSFLTRPANTPTGKSQSTPTSLQHPHFPLLNDSLRVSVGLVQLRDRKWYLHQGRGRAEADRRQARRSRKRFSRILLLRIGRSNLHRQLGCR